MKNRIHLGQHFLMHAQIAARIADAAHLEPDAVALEVGPGKGILTRELLKRARKVVAIEKDSALCDQLRLDFAEEITSGKLELICGDARGYPLNSAIAELRGYHVVANIPYYLTGELLRMFLGADHQPRSMTLLVQKEVAERVGRSAKESVISLSVKAYGDPSYVFTVPRGAFRPSPKVDSAVLAIRTISRTRFASNDHEKRFFVLIRTGFAHKRKLLKSNLAELIPLEAIRAAGISEDARAEDVPLDAWLVLSKKKS